MDWPQFELTIGTRQDKGMRPFLQNKKTKADSPVKDCVVQEGARASGSPPFLGRTRSQPLKAPLKSGTAAISKVRCCSVSSLVSVKNGEESAAVSLGATGHEFELDAVLAGFRPGDDSEIGLDCLSEVFFKPDGPIGT